MMLEITEAREEDAIGLYTVMRNTLYVEYQFGEINYLAARARIEQELIAPKDVHVLVAKIPCTQGENCRYGKQIVGYSIFVPYVKTFKTGKRNLLGEEYDFSEYAYSWGTGVHSDFRKRGIGQALRAAANNKAKKLGFEGMVTNVDSANKASIANQKRAGFKMAAKLPEPNRKSGYDTIWVKRF